MKDGSGAQRKTAMVSVFGVVKLCDNHPHERQIANMLKRLSAELNQGRQMIKFGGKTKEFGDSVLFLSLSLCSHGFVMHQSSISPGTDPIQILHSEKNVPLCVFLF